MMSDVKGGLVQIFAIIVTAIGILLYPKMPEIVRYQSLFWIPSAMVLFSFSFLIKMEFQGFLIISYLDI